MLPRKGYLRGLLITLLVGVQTAVAQQPSLTFRNYFTQHGLSYNLIYSLLEDREGYIWIGTFNGLNRFDGSRFITFKMDPDDPATLSNNVIHKMCEDSSGQIWLATGSGICRYNKQDNRFTRYFVDPTSPDHFRNNNFYNILCDRSGMIWCSSPGGLYRLHPAKGVFTSYKAGPNPGMLTSNDITRHSLQQDPRKNWLWMGTGPGGINIFDVDKNVFYNYRNNPFNIPVLNNHSAFPLIFDQKKQLVYADNNTHELVVYDPVSRAIVRHTEGVQKNRANLPSELNALVADQSNNYWISTFNYTLHQFNNASKTWMQFQHDITNGSSINSDYFNDVLEDRNGRLYFGCLNGLAIQDPAWNQYRLLQPLQHLPPSPVQYAISCLKSINSEQIYVGTNGAGFIKANLTREQYQYLRVPEPDPKCNDIIALEPRGNTVWLGTGAGVFLYDTLTKLIKKPLLPGFPALVENGYIRFIHHDRFNQTWISVSRTGIVQYDHRSGTSTLHKPDSLFIGAGNRTTARAIAEDREGNIWVGTYFGKLYRYHRTTATWQNIALGSAHSRQLLERTITSIHIDETNRVWMTTDGSGVIMYDPATKKFSNWMEKEGLLMDVCIDILGDKNGNKWVCSYEGVSIIDPRSGKVTYPRLDYGQKENNFFNRGYCILPNGNILLPNKGKIIQLDPQTVNTTVAVPQVNITGITIAGKYTPLYKNSLPSRFSYRDNIFTVDFSTPQAITNRNIEFSYRLMGLSGNWISGFQNSASFTGLPGGDYTFEVRARLPNGQWSPAATMSIYVQPPFWQTWWFRIVAALVVIGGLITYVKLRERRIIREQKRESDFREQSMQLEMKALRAQMNPHFIYNSLNSIRLFVMQNQNEDAEKYLVQFSRLMRLILENARQEWVSLQSELDLLRLYMELEQLRFDHKFSFHISIDETISPQQVFLPPMLLQPYVENAILHGIRHKTGKGNILISIRQKNTYLLCEIEDDGVGRAQAAQYKRQTVTTHKSVGTEVTAERIRLLKNANGNGASLQIIDKISDQGDATGTKVVLTLPLITGHH